MRFLILFLCLCAPNVIAQENSVKRTCRVLFLAKPSDAPEKLYLYDGATSQDVEPSSVSFSPVFQLRPGDITLALLLKAPPPIKAGMPPAIPAGVPNATIAASITDFYLILSSDPSNAVVPVKMQIINADNTHFKRGQMLWFNLTDNKVGGIVGTRKLLIQPNSRLILDAPASGMEDYHVNIHFQPPGKARTEPLCETNWSYDPRSRSVFFIIKPSGSLFPRIQGIPDFRSEVDSKPEGAP